VTVTKKKLALITATSPSEKLLIEKRIYDALKPLFKKDIKPEDIGLIWDFLDNVRVYEDGEITHFNLTATGDVDTPASGKALRVLGWFYYCTADITTELRFKTSGKVIAGLPVKGAVGMNLVGRKPPQGSANEIVEMYLSGAGTVKGWVCTVEV